MKFSVDVSTTYPSFMIPPKQEFWFGDPSYVFQGDFEPFWNGFREALLEAGCEHGNAYTEVIIDGTRYPIWIAGTRKGNGSFPFSWKVGAKIYAGCAVVEAGMLAILPTNYPGFNRQNDCRYVPFRTGRQATRIEIRDGSWYSDRAPVCVT